MISICVFIRRMEELGGRQSMGSQSRTQTERLSTRLCVHQILTGLSSGTYTPEESWHQRPGSLPYTLARAGPSPVLCFSSSVGSLCFSSLHVTDFLFVSLFPFRFYQT